jgi:hypothetical protein
MIDAYTSYNASKHADAAYRLHVNRAERARAALPFDGTLVMSKLDVKYRRAEGLAVRFCQNAALETRG